MILMIECLKLLSTLQFIKFFLLVLTSTIQVSNSSNKMDINFSLDVDCFPISINQCF
jgi:hypothetical protein